VAIANSLQLEASRSTPVLSRLRRHAKFEVAEPIHRALLPIHYFTLWSWPLISS